jgi:hypothetical protein
MEVVGPSEMLVSFYEIVQRGNPEDSLILSRRRGNLKFHRCVLIWSYP